MRRPSRSRPNWLTRRRSATRSCGACSCRRIRRARRTSRESYSYRGSASLRSEGVSVDAVFERDRRQLDVREQQLLAAVAEDDHCEVSRRRTCACIIVSMFRTHVPSTKYAGGFTVTGTFRLSLPRARACRYTILLPIGVLRVYDLFSFQLGVGDQCLCKLPGEEMTPSSITVVTPVTTLRVPDAVPPPVAPTNRPVPPSIVNSPTIANTGPSMGTKWP